MSKILLVDDSVVGLEAMSGMLRYGGGHEVHTAFSAAAAQGLLMGCEFDLMVFDYLMKEMRGDELLRWCRGRGIKTPCLLVSAVDCDELREVEGRAVADGLGPVASLSKIPERPSEILNVIPLLSRVK